MMKDQPKNLVKNRPLCEFKKGDTLYIRKTEHGMMRNYHVTFNCLSGGNVVGVVNYCVEEYSKFRQGDQITAKPSKCFLWDDYCYWFSDTKTGIGG
jgi:hypothetical protein